MIHRVHIGLAVFFIFLIGLSSCSKGNLTDPVRSASGSGSVDDNILMIYSNGGSTIEIQSGKIDHPLEFTWINNGIRVLNTSSVIYDLTLSGDSGKYSFGIVESGMTTASLAVPVKDGINRFEISWSDNPTTAINGHIIHTDGFKNEDAVWTSDREGYVANEVHFNFDDSASTSERQRVFREHDLFFTGINDEIGMYTARIDDGRNPYSVVRELSSEPSVKNPIVNGLVKACFWPSDIVWAPSWPDDYRWALLRIQARDGWDVYKDGILDGKGDASVDKIVLCIADTGVWPHEDFNKDYWHIYAAKKYSANFDSPGTPPLDYYGHGTSCAGIAGAQGDNGKGVAGVCWNPYIISVKCLSDWGYGSWETIANSISYIGQVADLYPWLKFVGSYSLGGMTNDPNVALAAQNTNARANTILIAAAGNWNDAYADSFYPAAYPEFMSIGASSIDMDGDLDMEVRGECPYGWGTNYGYTVDVCAPGSSAITTTNVPWTVMYDSPDPDCPESCTTWYCQFFGGTSAATPHVSGLAALLWNKHPDWTKEQVKEKIKSTADPMSIPPQKEGQLGTGHINVFRALTE